MIPETIYSIDPHEPRHHMTYSELDPLEYVGLVKTINENTHAHYSNLLKGVRLPKDACIITIGSDGKHERHAQSQSEFVLIIKNPDNGETRDKIMETLLNHKKNLHLDLQPHGLLEVKVIHSPLPCSYAYNESNRIYPDRYLNSSRIIGNKSTFQEIREKVINEITDSSPLGKRIREKMKDQLRDYQKTIRTGIFRGISNFDPSNGTQFYKEVEPYQFGFKPAYIRSVQRKFDITVGQKIRSKQLGLQDVVANLPSSTIDKFDFFMDRELIDKTLAINTASAYAWFLQKYHHIQEHYKNSHQPISLQSNANEFKYYSELITIFLKTAFT